MFDGLDDIDWEERTHAYGPADDVPDLLRSLISPDEQVRKDTLYELFGNIWHLGTVYEATIDAVPFLIELLAHPETPDKAGIASLLASIADGRGYLEVHARPELFEAEWKQILGKEGKGLETEQQRELDITQRVRRAAREALPLLVPFLEDPEADVRECVAPALAVFPECAEEFLPLLEGALAREVDDHVREIMEDAVQRLRQSRE